ncbi:phosphoribosylanthranilate isomerase [Bordetella sp. 2513F-2]
MRTRVKICGLTREADVAAACEAGADALGLVFYPKSRRCVGLEQAARLRRLVPPYVTVSALVVNAGAETLRAIVDTVGPDLLQFHGDEPPEQCRGHGARYVRAFRVGAPRQDSAQALASECARYGDAAGWLFDSYSPGYGGSGLALDQALLAGVQADAAARPMILAGGLTPANVEQAVRAVRPWAVDVSSGVEDAPGIKSAERIRAFIDAVRAADAGSVPA